MSQYSAFHFPSSKPKNKKDYYLQRFFEIAPGVISLSIIFSCFYFSYSWPVAIAIFIIIFDLYWLVRTGYISVFVIFAYRRIKIWEKEDWLGKYRAARSVFSSKEELKERKEDYNSSLTISSSNGKTDSQEIYHLVILPTYKEDIEILKASINSILNSDYPKNKIILVMAFEERAGDEAIEKAEILENQFSDKFFAYLTTIHPDGLAGEARVKGANLNWAAKEARLFLDEKNIKYENVLISAFDCDSCVHPKYFSCLAYKFLTAKNRRQLSFQPIPFYNNNIWQASAFVRVLMANSSFWQMIQSVRTGKMVTFSSHSMNFKTLVNVGYWPADIISDDSIIFWKCFSYYNGNYKTVPIYLPISMDAISSGNIFKDFVNQYKQLRRWAWGVENVPIVFRMFLENKKIPLAKKITRGWEEISGRISWGVAPIIITTLGWLPIILGGEKFHQTTIALNLPSILGHLMTLAMVGVLISILVFLLLLPPMPKETNKSRYFIMAGQWVLVPIIAIPLGAMPMLDAQIRLMLGKYLEFWVTEKKRN